MTMMKVAAPGNKLLSPGRLRMTLGPATTVGVTDMRLLAAPAPVLLLAVIEQAYVTPFIRPVTVRVAVSALGPALALTVGFPAAVQVPLYPVIGVPPLLTEGVKVSVALPGPGVASIIVGAEGGPVLGVTDAAPLAAPVPALLLAVTAQV